MNNKLPSNAYLPVPTLSQKRKKKLSKMWYAKKSGSLVSLTINWIANHSTNEENRLTPPLKLHV